MRIINLMLGKGRGGLEQAAVDYHEALSPNHAVLTVLAPNAWALEKITGTAETKTLRQSGEWDWLAAWKLHRIAREFGADCIIAHGNRAIGIALKTRQLSSFGGSVTVGAAACVREVAPLGAERAAPKIEPSASEASPIAEDHACERLAGGQSEPHKKPEQRQTKTLPIIGVAHNYNIQRRFPKLDACFAITHDLQEELAGLEIPRARIFHIPNMVRVKERSSRTEFRDPPVIGSMGRFVEKKGFVPFLHALAQLKNEGANFKAILGGDGPQALELTELAKQLGLMDHLTFAGWVNDREIFWDAIDIFVLPSLHEPFGIVLIEAMEAGLPCLTTDTEGPCEIITQHHDAMMIDKNDPDLMATMLMEMLAAPEATLALGHEARRTVGYKYDIRVIGQKITHALNQVKNQLSS